VRQRERAREAIGNCVDTCFIFYSSQSLVTMGFCTNKYGFMRDMSV